MTWRKIDDLKTLTFTLTPRTLELAVCALRAAANDGAIDKSERDEVLACLAPAFEDPGAIAKLLIGDLTFNPYLPITSVSPDPEDCIR